MVIKEEDIWAYIASVNLFKVLDLLSDAEKGLMKGKKLHCKKPFSQDPKMNEAISKYFESKGVILIKE
jgi:hypothetical protein